jgi:hypothetical protein
MDLTPQELGAVESALFHLAGLASPPLK